MCWPCSESLSRRTACDFAALCGLCTHLASGQYSTTVVVSVRAVSSAGTGRGPLCETCSGTANDSSLKMSLSSAWHAQLFYYRKKPICAGFVLPDTWSALYKGPRLTTEIPRHFFESPFVLTPIPHPMVQNNESETTNSCSSITTTKTPKFTIVLLIKKIREFSSPPWGGAGGVLYRSGRYMERSADFLQEGRTQRQNVA